MTNTIEFIILKEKKDCELFNRRTVTMKILFFDTKNYDKDSFEKQIANYPEIEMDYLKAFREATQL